MSLVEAEDLVKHYGKVTAVDGLSLMVEEGSITGLIGPNGSGKTTTIKIALGLLKQDRGQVKVFNEDPWDNPDIRYRIGVIYEKAYFPPNHTVVEYLKRACRVFGKPEDRAWETLTMVGLENAYSRPIRGLSAGMLQKFSVAHALINEPDLIIADEPTANLDPEARSNLLDLILRLNRDGKTTFLISSHILPELSRICNYIAIISRGRVWAQGRLEELSQRFGAKVVRISTNKPESLAEEARRLSYVTRIEPDSRGILIGVASGEDETIYTDILELARRIGARVTGIESGTASLEELFRLAVKSDQGGVSS
ncbi:MAG: ABC transporter ATP-binding protein [Thermoproteota archaeon]